MSRPHCLLLCLLAPLACGGAPPAATAPARAAAPSPPSAEASSRPASLLWWQGAEPRCSTGTLARRNLSWGAVFWCEVPGVKVDANLQNDLGRLARCVQESVSAFQVEPAPGELGDFLARAHEEGLNPVLCAAVRRDSEPRTYNGREILLERRELSPAADEVGSGAAGERQVHYRFSCEDCLVAAETRVLVAR